MESQMMINLIYLIARMEHYWWPCTGALPKRQPGVECHYRADCEGPSFMSTGWCGNWYPISEWEDLPNYSGEQGRLELLGNLYIYVHGVCMYVHFVLTFGWHCLAWFYIQLLFGVRCMCLFTQILMFLIWGTLILRLFLGLMSMQRYLVHIRLGVCVFSHPHVSRYQVAI